MICSASRNMNWTGGTLQRTKHANKGVSQKQKAHFARARTKLQQSLATPAAPFRPDYLHDGDDCELRQRHLSFGSDSVRPTRHSAGKRHEIAGHRSPTMQRLRRPADQGSSQKARPCFLQGRRHSAADNETQHERKRKNADADTETQLLEANKKRLLTQQDWVGVAPLRPVDMQSWPIKEKSRIGLRRQLDKKSKAQARRHSPTTFRHQIGQDELTGQDITLMSGALPVITATDNIRIRIGSDVLTTAASTQPNNYARSQTNSDSMLFDEEGESTAWRTESEARRGTAPASYVQTADPRSSNYLSAEADINYSPQQGPYAHHNLTGRPDPRAAEYGERAQLHEGHAVSQSAHQSEATGPSYRLTHHVVGVERPLKLVFGKKGPSMTSLTASASHQIGELQCVHADLDAEETEIDQASRNVGEVSRLGVRRHPNPPSIDDDEPWRPYLDTCTSSSGHVRVDDGTGTSVPQPHVAARNTRADRTSWPQHTAHGNLTHVNLLKVSAPLPAVLRRSAHIPEARSLRRTNAAKEVNEDEALWQAYVLGSDPQSAIETIHTQDETSEDSMSRATKGYASTRLPMSNTVTPTSSTPFPSTPFKSLSGQASRISDDVQYALRAGSRSIISAAPYDVWGHVESPSEEDVQDEHQSEETSACSRFGEHCTHASVQNHASRDSAMFSDTRTSRSDLDQRGHAWGDVSRRGQASGSAV